MKTVRHNGMVKWYSEKKGYGYLAIAPSLKLQFGIPAEKDLFVHAENLALEFPRILRAEQQVEFEVAVTERGPRAVDVRLATRHASLVPA